MMPGSASGVQLRYGTASHPFYGSPSRRPFLTLPTYLASLVGSFLLCGLCIHGLSGYSPPSHHDELIRLPSPSLSRSGSSSGAPSHSTISTLDMNSVLAGRSWNSLANALGGFSTSFIHAPSLNASWISRPAGFGPRIVKDAGLRGTLHTWADYTGGRVERDTNNKACDVESRSFASPSPAPTHNSSVPRIVLIERGDCPFITKLLHAQAANASAVIVYNDATHASGSQRQLDDDDKEGRAGSRDIFDRTEEDELISMWSPTREAHQLHIPSVFVSYHTGQTLLHLASLSASSSHEGKGSLKAFEIVMEAEEPPHLFLMDIIILLLFAPSLFTTVVVVLSKIRRLRQRKKQRAPQSLVDTLPSFRWRENLQISDLEKDLEASAGTDEAGSSSMSESAGQSSILSFIAQRLRRASTSSAQPTTPTATTSKARHLAKKIFSQRECAICLADFVTDDRVRLLPCGHVFHVVSKITVMNAILCTADLAWAYDRPRSTRGSRSRSAGAQSADAASTTTPSSRASLRPRPTEAPALHPREQRCH